MSQRSDHATGDQLSLLLVIAPDPESDPEDVDRLTRQLRTELAELDVESVRPAAGGTVPEGAKGVDPATLSGLLVALSASGGVFTALLDTVRDWLDRHSGRHRVSVTIDGDTIELDRASDRQQQELVKAYVRRHTGGA